MDKTKFFENYFKLLTLLFWPIIWYTWVSIPNATLEFILFTIFSVLAFIYIFTFFIFAKNNKFIKQAMFFYRVTTLLAFVFSLLSFMLYPKSYTLLYLKMIFIFIYFYFSTILVYKHKIEEGVVGILSSLLLTVITLLY